MSKQFEHMQKLAFGKTLPKETLSEADLRNKIKELVHSSLGEAKKKKKKDVAPQDDTVDMDLNMDTEMSTEETPTDTMAPETSSDIDIDPKIKSVQDYLQKAYANAKELGDEKLMTQIGNTITMVVRNQVLGGQVAESLDEMVGDLGKYDYLSNALNHVWNMGKGNNSIDFDDMAKSIIDDLESRFTESLNEKSNSWDKKSIDDFFNYLTSLGIKGTVYFNTNKISGLVKMMIDRKKYIANFNVTKGELVFMETVESDLASLDFTNYLDKKGADQKYDYFNHGTVAAFSQK